jgi:low affinity Fe/Cu permease
MRISDVFHRFSQSASALMGTPWSFALALLVIAVWALTGPIFRFSDTWQLVINTGTTIVTFLMVFLIQNTQNRDAKAIHLKLNELLRAVGEARNRLLSLEEMSEEELNGLQAEFAKLRDRATNLREVRESHKAG